MRLLISLIVLLAECVSLFSGGQKIWGVPEEDFLHSVISKTHPIFTADDASSYPLRELDSMAPGAGFFLSFYEYKDSKTVYRLLEYEIERGQYLFALFSARRLMELLIRDNLDREAEVLGMRLTRLFPDDYYLSKTYAASRYWQKRDVASVMEDLRQKFPRETANDAEYQLFRAVNAIRTGRADWEDEVEALVTGYTASSEHTRFYGYVRIHSLEKSLEPKVLDCLLSKLHIQDRRFTQAFSLIKNLPADMVSGAVLDDLYTAAIGSGQLSAAIDVFDRIINTENASSAQIHAARMYRGFLYRKKGLWADALEDFSFSADHASDAYTKQRMAWYVLFSLVKTDPGNAFERFSRFKGYVYDADYFSDALSEWVYDLLASRQYRQIEVLYGNVKEFASPSFLSFISYLIFRLDNAGIETTSIDKNELTANILNPDGDLYYRALYSHITGQPGEGAESGKEYADLSSDGQGHPIVIRGFFEFGLEEIAFDYLSPYKDELSDEGVISLSRSLIEADRPWEAIRVAQWRSGNTSSEFFRQRFPRGFEKDVETEASRHDLPSWLLYALIRTESFFNPTAVSHAGAVGLSQLMPETARDVSRRLGLSGVDLTDPASNILIGSWYISHLMSRTDSPAFALLAYNAGLTRVRRWQADWQGIPPDLCVELVPYDETRNYVKKILRSSLSYAGIYGTAEFDEVLSYIFPQ